MVDGDFNRATACVFSSGVGRGLRGATAEGEAARCITGVGDVRAATSTGATGWAGRW